jgi:hypothetical protein
MTCQRATRALNPPGNAALLRSRGEPLPCVTAPRAADRPWNPSWRPFGRGRGGGVAAFRAPEDHEPRVRGAVGRRIHAERLPLLPPLRTCRNHLGGGLSRRDVARAQGNLTLVVEGPGSGTWDGSRSSGAGRHRGGETFPETCAVPLASACSFPGRPGRRRRGPARVRLSPSVEAVERGGAVELRPGGRGGLRAAARASRSCGTPAAGRRLTGPFDLWPGGSVVSTARVAFASSALPVQRVGHAPASLPPIPEPGVMRSRSRPRGRSG